MIYTAGYIGHPSSALKQLAINLDATVVDIRVSPRSANPFYQQKSLSELLGDRYAHIIEWGNVNYKGEGPIRIADLAKGLKRFRQIKGNTILLCACRDYHTCHRKVIADLLIDTQEISAAQWNAATLGQTQIGAYALSVRQPWAYLLSMGLKDIENRNWYSPFRGEFWIHTGTRFDHDGYDWVKYHFPQIKFPREFPRGGLVGRANMIDCVDHSDSPWFVGPYGFLIDQAQPVPFVRMPGALNFFRFEMPVITEPQQENLFTV